MIHGELLLNGVLVGGPCDSSVGKQLVRSPWDDAVVGVAAEGGYPELRTAIECAAEAFPAFAASPTADRRALLERIAQRLRDRREELADLLTREAGKPTALSLAEVDRTAITFQLAADELAHWGRQEVELRHDARADGVRAFVDRMPVGPVFAIVPYNWPFNLSAHKLAPALAVGCPVVLKVSEKTPLCGLQLARLIHEAGCPYGVLNSWNGPTPCVRKALSHPSIGHISFTGSGTVGWGIRADHPAVPVTLELGGDAFVLMGPDANLDEAIPKIVAGAFAYAGQVCISVQHVLAHESILWDVRERLAAATRDLPHGTPDSICGPMIDLEAAERVEGWILEAIAAGAHPLHLGARNGRFLAPTLLEDVPPDQKLAREEAFGPVMDLAGFSDWEAAFARVNASQYGIHTGIFTSDDDVIERAFRTLRVGGVVVQDVPNLRFDALPYGGEKRSGWGREGVRAAMEEFSRPKTLVRRHA